MPRGEDLPRRKKRRSVVLIKGDAGRKYETKWTCAGDSLALENVILVQSAHFTCISAGIVALLTHSSQRCRRSHDISAYLKAKPRDIFFPSESMLSNEPPFVGLPDTANGIKEESEEPFESESVDFLTRCPPFETTGSCRIGLKCRFLGGHMRKAEDGTVSLVEDEEKKRATLTTELNFVSPSTLKLLRTKKVDLYFIPSYSKYEIK